MSHGDFGSRILNAVFVLVIAVALAVTVLVLALPKENVPFTNFYILDKDGKADNYPAEIVAGKNYPMYIGVENHEKRNVLYSIEIWNLETEYHPETNTTQTIFMDAKDRFSFTLADNESTVIPYTLSVGNTDFNRVAFLLFNETIPPLSVLSGTGDLLSGRGDRINASYRNLYLRVSFQQPVSGS